MQYTLRFVTIEKQTALVVFCYPKMVPDNLSNRAFDKLSGTSMAANFTSQTAAIKACYTLNMEECFRQEVWRPEI